MTKRTDACVCSVLKMFAFHHAPNVFDHPAKSRAFSALNITTRSGLEC